MALVKLVVSGANVLLLDEPTKVLDPASRKEILGTLEPLSVAVVLVSNDAGAVKALNPEKLLSLSADNEDYWSEVYGELISLS